MRLLPILLVAPACSPSSCIYTAAFTSPVSASKFPRPESKCRRLQWFETSLRSHVDGGSDATQDTASSQSQDYWKLPRLYVEFARLRENGIVTLSPDQTHYLTKVMRYFKKRKHNDDDGISTKDCLRIFNGQDGEWLAKVIPPSQEDNGRKRKRQRNDVPLQAECLVRLRKQSSDVQPWLIFAPLKNQSRMKLVIEKCTELGVGAIIMAKSDRMDGTLISSMSSSSSNDDNLVDVYDTKAKSREEGVSVEKLKLQAIEAAEQCERLTIPTITADLSSILDVSIESQDVLSVGEIVKLWGSDLEITDDNSRKLLVCRERSEQSTEVVPVLNTLRDHKNVTFIVGPEGGWSPEEEAVFDDICTQDGTESPIIQCVSLGSSVLRAETACMMAVGAWSLVHN
jgi:16S rRNA (uracil1498-N3)-methyltransferase